MKKLVVKLDPTTVAKEYPIADRLKGWFFRIKERSVGVWIVEGTDLWGRTVSECGLDEQQLLVHCINTAKKIANSNG